MSGIPEYVTVSVENEVLRERLKRADAIIGMASTLLSTLAVLDAIGPASTAAAVLSDMITEYKSRRP